MDDDIGKEIVSVFSAGGDVIDNAGHFFTDSNGRQMMERILDYRPTFEIEVTEPVAENYYAVNSKIQVSLNHFHLRISKLNFADIFPNIRICVFF